MGTICFGHTDCALLVYALVGICVGFSMSLDYAAFFEKSPTPTMALNENLEFIAANAAYLEMVDRSCQEIMGRYVFDAFPEAEDRVQDLRSMFEQVLEGKETEVVEVPFRLLRDGVEVEQFWNVRNVPVIGSGGQTRCLIQYSKNVTDQVRMREMQDAVMAEQQHRIGNLFAIVSSVARQTARTSATVADFLPRFQDRVAAMVRVNRSLLGNEAEASDFASIIDHQLTVFPDDVRQRIVARGPHLALSVLQAQAVSMAIYELGANSMKYGAIGNPDGQIEITWDRKEGDGCHLEWKETGFETENTSGGSGYGTMLLSTIIPRQLGGKSERQIEPDSFVYRLSFGDAPEQAPAESRPQAASGGAGLSSGADDGGDQSPSA